MPRVIVGDTMGLSTTLTSVATDKLCELLTAKVVMGLPQSNLFRNTPDQGVSMGQNDCPGSISEEWAWYPLQRPN